MTIKAGDRVVCTDADGFDEGEFLVGKEYTVEWVNDKMIILAGADYTTYLWRFNLV